MTQNMFAIECFNKKIKFTNFHTYNCNYIIQSKQVYNGETLKKFPCNLSHIQSIIYLFD